MKITEVLEFIKTLTPKQRVKVLKAIVDESDIILTAYYGAEDTLCSDEIVLSTDESQSCIATVNPGETIFIHTSISTG